MPKKVSPGLDAAQDEELLARRAKSRANYIKACSQRLVELVEQARQEFRQRYREVARARTRYLKLARQCNFAYSDVSEIERRAEFLSEMDRVRAVPKVVAVKMVAGAVIVYTDTLCAIDPSTSIEHAIGKFMIVIRFNGQVLWFNSDRKVDGALPGMNAPQIYADGTSACTEFDTTFLELIAKLEIASMADLAIQYIETYEEDELWKFVKNWPATAVRTSGDTDARR